MAQREDDGQVARGQVARSFSLKNITGYRGAVSRSLRSLRLSGRCRSIINPRSFETRTIDVPSMLAAAPAPLAGTGFYDNLCIINSNGLLTPAPFNPGSTLSTEQISSREQGWFVGSANSGQGILVQIDTVQRYIDHGAHQAIQSPAP